MSCIEWTRMYIMKDTGKREKDMNEEKKPNKIWNWAKKVIKPKHILIVIAVVVVCGVGLGVKDRFSTDSEVIKLKFENIGEMATQAAYLTSIDTIDVERDIYGLHIPFTQSKCILSFNSTIKAGIDFSKVKWDLDDDKKTISVNIPEIIVISNEPNFKSLKIWHEEESIFRNITADEHNKAMIKMQEKALETAKENGLFELAKENAKKLLTEFFGQEYDMNTYKIQFEGEGA